MSRSRWRLAAATFLAASAVLASHAAGAEPNVGPELPTGAVARFGEANLRHGGRITGLVALDGGKRIATLGDRDLCIWDANTGRLVASAELPTLPPPQPLTGAPPIGFPFGWSLTATADGTALVSLRAGVGFLHPLPLNEVAPTQLPRLDIDDRITSVAPAAQTGIVGLSWKGALFEWKPGDQKWAELKTQAVLETGKLAAGGGVVASFEKKGGVLLRNTVKGENIGQVNADALQAVAVSADGKRFATLSGPAVFPGGKPSVIEVRTVGDRKSVARWEVRNAATRVALSPDGTLAAVGSSLLETLELYDVQTGTRTHELPVPEGGTWFIAFLNATNVVTAGLPGVIRVWDAKTGKSRFPESGHLDGVGHLVPLSDGRWASAGSDGMICVWKEGKAELRFRAHRESVTGLAASRDGKSLYSAGTEGFVREWETATGKESRKVLVGGPAYALTMSPDGKFLVAGGSGGRMPLIDTSELKTTKTLKAKADKLNSKQVEVIFTPGGALLARDAPNTARVWDVEKGEIRSFSVPCGASGETVRASVSPDGKYLAAATLREDARLFDPPTDVGVGEIETGKLIHRLKTDAKGRVTAVAFVADGKEVAVGDQDGTIWVMDVEKKALRQSFKGHRGAVLGLAASPDGKSLASGGADTTVLVWRLEKP